MDEEDQLCTQTRLDIGVRESERKREKARESEEDLVGRYVMRSRAEHRGSDENEVTEVSAAGIRNQKKEKVQSGSGAGNNWMTGRWCQSSEKDYWRRGKCD